MNLYAALTMAVLLVFGRSVQAQSASIKKVPVGIPSDASFFNGKWYRIYLEKTTWKRARDKCETVGGRLACPSDAYTQGFIAGFAKTLELWIGASDAKVEGQWIWCDGAEMKYSAWGNGQPVRNNRNENYLGIGAGGRWFDAPNEWPCVGYICEWKDR